jgi:hypothetical protein
MNPTATLEEALRDLARVTATTAVLNHYLAVLVIVLTVATFVGFFWVGHAVRATNLMLREVLRRTPEGS